MQPQAGITRNAAGPECLGSASGIRQPTVLGGEWWRDWPIEVHAVLQVWRYGSWCVRERVVVNRLRRQYLGANFVCMFWTRRASKRLVTLHTVRCIADIRA